MFEIDKMQFGQFLSERRKEKAYTQKELAQRLYVSDKAVSKWERGLSMPDISLLMPLADILEVSVVELLEGRIIEKEKELDTNQVEALVKKALAFSEEAPEAARKRRRQRIWYFGSCVLAAGLEVLVFFLLGWMQFPHASANQTYIDFYVLELLAVIFGCYFWIFAKEKLPVYYDENKICYYGDGIFRMNMPGIHFNNSNWRYILRGMRIWTAAVTAAFPLVSVVLLQFLPEQWKKAGDATAILVTLGTLFGTIYVLGKKYE